MAQDVVKRVAENTRALREGAGLSLSELARRAGLSKGALSQIEAAQANPTVETLWSLAQALGVPFSELIVEPRLPAEHVVLHSGRMRVGPVDAPVVLAAGDSATYVADRPHVYEALAPDTTGLILMSYPASGARA